MCSFRPRPISRRTITTLHFTNIGLHISTSLNLGCSQVLQALPYGLTTELEQRGTRTTEPIYNEISHRTGSAAFALNFRRRLWNSLSGYNRVLAMIDLFGHIHVTQPGG